MHVYTMVILNSQRSNIWYNFTASIAMIPLLNEIFLLK